VLDDESDATRRWRGSSRWPRRASPATLGGFGSDLHAAAASVAEKNKIRTSASRSRSTNPPAGLQVPVSPFWKSPDIGKHTQGLLGLIPAGERPKTVAIFQEKTDWGQEMAAAWTEAGKAAGYQVVVHGEYAPGARISPT